jgi:ABC-type dipeptide/oligopeptide/nickel transport system permease component
MVIFATPDFGAGAAIAGIVLLAWAATLVVVVGGVIVGASLLRSKALFFKRGGMILLLASLSVPLFCCLGPPCLIRVAYGNFPIGSFPYNKIKEGMAPEEVIAVLGPPHERVMTGNGENWYYWRDSFDINWVCVEFGTDGRVFRTRSN